MEVKIVIHRIGRGHYAKVLENGEAEPANVELRVEGHADTEAQLDELKERARNQARKHGIREFIIGLDS